MNTMQKPTEKKSYHILGSFIWERGSINDNIRDILIAKDIEYTNTFNGDVLIKIGSTWQKVRHIFTDIERTNCLVYLRTGGNR